MNWLGAEHAGKITKRCNLYLRVFGFPEIDTSYISRCPTFQFYRFEPTCAEEHKTDYKVMGTLPRFAHFVPIILM